MRNSNSRISCPQTGQGDYVHGSLEFHFGSHAALVRARYQLSLPNPKPGRSLTQAYNLDEPVPRELALHRSSHFPGLSEPLRLHWLQSRKIKGQNPLKGSDPVLKDC